MSKEVPSRLGRLLSAVERIFTGQEEPVCVIVRGLDPRTKFNLVHCSRETIERVVPENSRTILFGGRKLILVGRWRNDSIELINPEDGQEADFGSTTDIHFLYPCAIVTKDGRIFQDLDLLCGDVKQNDDGFAEYLTQLVWEFGGNRKP